MEKPIGILIRMNEGKMHFMENQHSPFSTAASGFNCLI
jgi:hypothetical protein